MFWADCISTHAVVFDFCLMADLILSKTSLVISDIKLLKKFPLEFPNYLYVLLSSRRFPRTYFGDGV